VISSCGGGCYCCCGRGNFGHLPGGLSRPMPTDAWCMKANVEDAVGNNNKGTSSAVPF
jgi:hypothetical protein